MVEDRAELAGAVEAGNRLVVPVNELVVGVAGTATVGVEVAQAALDGIEGTVGDAEGDAVLLVVLGKAAAELGILAVGTVLVEGVDFVNESS